MVVPLPKYVAITTISRKKFLRPTGSSGLLKLDDVDILSWGVKHEVVQSKIEPGMVHIKCVDTGKYWSWGLDSDSEDYIAAQRKNKETDQSSNACTLIKYSSHTRNGVSVFKLRFMWESEWHVICQDDRAFLVSGVRKGGETSTNFVIEDWEKLARSSQSQKHTSTGKPKMITGGGATTKEVEYQMQRMIVRESCPSP